VRPRNGALRHGRSPGSSCRAIPPRTHVYWVAATTIVAATLANPITATTTVNRSSHLVYRWTSSCAGAAGTGRALSQSARHRCTAGRPDPTCADSPDCVGRSPAATPIRESRFRRRPSRQGRHDARILLSGTGSGHLACLVTRLRRRGVEVRAAAVQNGHRANSDARPGGMVPRQAV
jgi:hypothetical protein